MFHKIDKKEKTVYLMTITRESDESGNMIGSYR